MIRSHLCQGYDRTHSGGNPPNIPEPSRTSASGPNGSTTLLPPLAVVAVANCHFDHFAVPLLQFFLAVVVGALTCVTELTDLIACRMRNWARKNRR